MSDIDIQLDRLGQYPAVLTGMAGRVGQFAAEATAFTSSTGREDSAAAASGLAEHLDALLADIRTALDHDADEVDATRNTLLAVDQESGDIFHGILGNLW